MARIMSPAREALDSLRTPLTAGERMVLDFFDRSLPEEWEIYIQPHLNGLRPDFVLLNPRVGIGVFEVKDWNLDAMDRWVEEGPGGAPTLWGRDASGRRFRIPARDNPIAKVEEYKKAILSLYCPRLAIRASESPGFVAVVTAGVIMTAASTERAQPLFAPMRRRLDYPSYYPLAGREAIERGDLGAVFPSSRYTTSKHITPELAKDLRSWLVEPDVAATQREPLKLDRDQRGLVTSRAEKTGHRRIKGPAGSGKSVVLAARAAQLTSEGKDVLVVTFNRTLWHYLRDLAVRYPVPGRRLSDGITWLHFHEWCKRVCTEAGLEDQYDEIWRAHIVRSSDPDDPSAVLDREIPSLVRRALDEAGDRVSRYDAVLVDEGQDCNLEWWNLLRRVVRHGGECVLSADETQDLYSRTKHWTDEAMLGAGFHGRPAHLRSSYRMPPALISQLREFITRYLPVEAANVPEAEQLELDFYRVKLRWLQTTPERAARDCVKAVLGMPSMAEPDGLSFSDVTLW